MLAQGIWLMRSGDQEVLLDDSKLLTCLQIVDGPVLHGCTAIGYATRHNAR